MRGGRGVSTAASTGRRGTLMSCRGSARSEHQTLNPESSSKPGGYSDLVLLCKVQSLDTRQYNLFLQTPGYGNKASPNPNPLTPYTKP
jgi:hypothetical protein